MENEVKIQSEKLFMLKKKDIKKFFEYKVNIDKMKEIWKDVCILEKKEQILSGKMGCMVVSPF